MPILVGFLVLAGWAFDIEILKRPKLSFVAMNPMTACLFILSGALLGLSLQRRPLSAVLWIRKIGALLLLAIAGAKIVELGLGWPTHVDQWLFTTKLAGANGALPSRMAPNTAATFSLIALSLFSLDFR